MSFRTCCHETAFMNTFYNYNSIRYQFIKMTLSSKIPTTLFCIFHILKLVSSHVVGCRWLHVTRGKPRCNSERHQFARQKSVSETVHYLKRYNRQDSLCI